MTLMLSLTNVGAYFSFVFIRTENMSKKSGTVDVSNLVSWRDGPRGANTVVSLRDMDEDLNDRIIIWRGDITCLQIDAIVNAANEQLASGGGICGSIFAGAGPKLQSACNKLGGCATGRAKVTPGFNLPSKYILHAVGPIYSKAKSELARQQLASCYTSCLDQATVFNMRSIAFCCISTGIYGYPKDDAAKVAFGTVRAWLEDGNNRNDIDKIVFCVFDEHDERLYRATAAQFFPRSKDIAPSIPAPTGVPATHAGATQKVLPSSKGFAFTGDMSTLLNWEQDPAGTFASPEDPRVNAALNSRLALFDGDITTLPASVLVYTTNKSYVDRGAITQYNAQHAAADYHLERKQVLTKPGIFGELRCTSGGALPCKYLYHVAGQEYSASQAQRCRAKLCEIYTHCLTEAAAQGDVKTICFTPLLVDIFSFPPALTCEIATTTVREWMDERVQNKLRFDQIIFATQCETHKDLHTTFAECMSQAFPRMASASAGSELDSSGLAEAFAQKAAISRDQAAAANLNAKATEFLPHPATPQKAPPAKKTTPQHPAATDTAVNADNAGDPKSAKKTPGKSPGGQHSPAGKKATPSKGPTTPIYIAPRLAAEEANILCAAGVLLYRFNHSTQQMEVLMGLELSSVSLLGGKRSGPAEIDVDTASREFYEETGGQVNVDALRTALRASKTTTASPQPGIEVCWLPRGKYALFLVHVDAVPGLHDDTVDVDQKFANFVSSPGYRTAPHEYKEMTGLKWMPAARFVSPPFPKANNWAVSVFSAAPVKEWIVKKAAELKPHLASVLREKIECERDKAIGEVPALQARLTKHSVPIPPVSRSQIAPVSDLTFLAPASAEYQKVAHKFHSLAPITAIKKVNVTSRASRFHQYTQALPAAHAQIEHSFHGTSNAASADAIARNGPDLTKAGQSNGTALGSGFYTTQNVNTAFSYCKGGSICVLRVAPGVSSTAADTNTTASSLASLTPPCSSVTHQAAQDDRWFILFHSDAVVVDYIVTFGHAGEGTSEEDRLRQQAYEKKVRERDAQETAREAKIVQIQSHMTMVDYFVKACDEASAGLTEGNATVRNAKFDLEIQQFSQKLPMYGRKGEFLDCLKSSQTLILKGGTGIGKTVTVPQWCLDNLMCTLDTLPSHRVAVLVPRKAIATAMAQYICQLRRCTLGEDVGFGTGDEHKYTDQSRIVFFTYGFFAAIPKDKMLSKWNAIVMDEFHERAIGADVIWPMVIEASRARSADNFKVIVMSATIDTAELAEKFTIKNISGKKVVPQILEVPGVTFPVEDIWWDGEQWDPASAGALDDLCCEVQRVFNHEESGNVLVFLSKVSDIHECVKIMRGLLSHDHHTDVLPLSASLPEAERDKVQHFNDHKRYPANKGRRLICFSTNVAEAGVTIPGITAVVDTGREINVTYDLNLKANVSEVSWISQASQRQRRGRAGRTAPGRCYCMYSQEDFNNMPEFSTPRIMKANCAKFYLSLVANNMNPAEIKLFDCPEDRMEAAKQSLVRLKAITVNSLTGAPTITKLGEVIYRLPVDISLAKSIIAGAECNCCEPMAIIAAVLTACEVRSLYVGSNEEQITAKKAFASGTSGEHETALMVYESWAAAGKRRSWATEHHISHDLLQEADETLSKIHQILSSAADISLSYPPHGPQRSAMIVESIVHGFPDNIAIAKDPTNIKEQFSVVEGSETNPLYAKLLPSAALVVSQPSTPHTVDMVVYHSLSSSRSSGEFYFKYATAVSKSVVEKVGRNQLGDVEFAALKKRLSQMSRDSSSRDMGTMEKHELEAFRANIKELNREFAHAVIKTSGNCTVHVACLATEKDTIWKRIVGAIKCAKDASQDIFVTKSDIKRWLQGSNNKLTRECQAVRDALREQFLGGASAPKAGEKAFSIQFDGDFAACKITVRTNGTILDEVVEAARTALGESGAASASPAKAGSAAGTGGNVGGGSGGMTADERLRLETLLSPCTDYKALAQRIRRTPALGGKTIGGSILLLAHAVIWQTNCWIYGGYLRDFIVRGEVHDAMDLDIGLPKTGNLSGDSALSNLLKVMARCEIDFNLRKKNAKGPHVYEAIFNDTENHTFSIEFVDAKHYMAQETHVDFDGCNLMISNAGSGSPQLRLKYPGQGGDVSAVCSNIRQKRLVVIRNINKMSERFSKMKQRGWKIILGSSSG